MYGQEMRFAKDAPALGMHSLCFAEEDSASSLSAETEIPYTIATPNKIDIRLRHPGRAEASEAILCLRFC